MTDIAKCAECKHPIDMHVKGSAPRYAGCMVMTEKGVRVPTCPCSLTPDQASGRATLATTGEKP